MCLSKLINQSTAMVSGSPAVLLDRLLRSPNVAKVLSCPPSWVDFGDLATTVAAIHLAGRAWAEQAAREDATVLNAVVPDCPSVWTVQRAAEYLQLSQRRTQEIARAQLGGRKSGRAWVLDEVAVRVFERERRGVA
jgi:hypothetical protein